MCAVCRVAYAACVSYVSRVSCTHQGEECAGGVDEEGCAVLLGKAQQALEDVHQQTATAVVAAAPDVAPRHLNRPAGNLLRLLAPHPIFILTIK